MAGWPSRTCAPSRSSLQARIRRIQARLAVPAGGKAGRTRGYATPAERHAKTLRLQALEGPAGPGGAATGRRGRCRWCGAGRPCCASADNLAAAGLTEAQWRRQWESARLFLTADGEKDKAWGNETIRWNPDEGWLEVKLPAPLAHLANRPHGRYRLSCPVAFSYRGDEVAAQAATGAVRYDISHDPARGRWYIDAALEGRARPRARRWTTCGSTRWWLSTSTTATSPPPSSRRTATSWAPRRPSAWTWPGCPSATRDGHLRAAITSLIATAKAHGARAIVIEDLDFAGARAEGRERTAAAPRAAGAAGPSGVPVSGIPTGKLRDRLTQMAANTGLSVIVVDPAYTSRWGAEHWLRPLREHHPKATGHHAAALVIGRRGLGHRARRRATGNQTAPEEAARPAQARPRTTPAPGTAPRKPAAPPGPRQPPGTKTGRPHRTTAGNQAAQDRSGPPARQGYVLLAQQER